jgi:hypothetical protein
LSIPKIAISNEDDSSLRILETRLKSTTPNSNTSSPYKSIIKTRPPQPRSPSSSTTQSFHTCVESTRKDSSDQSSKLSFPLERSATMTLVKDNSNQTLRKNHSFTTIENVNHQINPIRRINSYHSSSTQRFVVPEDKSNENFNSNLKRRLTVDNFIYPMIYLDTSSVYETPKHDQYFDNSIRLVIDTDTTMQITTNDQSDMKVDKTKTKNQPQNGVSFSFVRSRLIVRFV